MSATLCSNEKNKKVNYKVLDMLNRVYESCSHGNLNWTGQHGNSFVRSSI